MYSTEIAELQEGSEMNEKEMERFISRRRNKYMLSWLLRIIYYYMLLKQIIHLLSMV